MQNNIFEKNIQALSLKDKELALKLLEHVLTDVPNLVQENGAYNLSYKNRLLHNPLNPLGEAKEIFSMCENTPTAIHLIYGIGLGYLFQVASVNSQGTVILYESDLNILKIAFNLVDFSNDILKKNVFIAETLDKAGDYIYQKSNMKNTPRLLSTNAYRELDEIKFNDLVEQLQRLVGMFSLDLKYTTQKFYSNLIVTLQNIPSLIKETPLAELKDFYKGKTAVVVSAGPTLDRNIETIKKYRENVVLIVVGTAMKAISKHNITPDFLCIIESYDSSKQVEDLDLSNVNLVVEPYTHPNLRNFKFKNIYSHISANMPINLLWSEISEINIEEYWSKGTVSYTALNVARILGCSKIVLVGQDLAYFDGQCYSKDSAYKDLECKYNPEKKKWEIVARDFDNFVNAISNSPDKETRVKAAQTRLENLNKSLFYVKGINGDMIPTESVYSAFINPLKEFAEKFNDREYINTSLVGAQIEGFKNISLEEALSNTEKIINRELTTNFQYNRENIIENLKQAIIILNSGVNKINEGKQILKNLNNEIKRHKNITVDVLKILKKLSVNYTELSVDFSNKSKLFDFMTTAERIDTDYEFKMTREITIDKITIISGKISNYFEKGENRIKYITELLNNIIKEI